MPRADVRIEAYFSAGSNLANAVARFLMLNPCFDDNKQQVMC